MKMHRKKLLLHRASMTEFAQTLRDVGHGVTHFKCSKEPTDTLAILERYVPARTTVLRVVDPVDDLLRRRLSRFVKRRNLKLELLPSPNFITPQSFLDEQFSKKQKPFMARFYEAQRRRMNILLEKDGSPLGGRWSFDLDNRKKLLKQVVVPELHFPEQRESIRQAQLQIEKDFPDASGELKDFIFPVTHEDAEAWLNDFFTWRFSSFGPYEDSISSRHDNLFHSVLTPCLNIGLLNPSQVVEKALDHASTHEIPLNSLEGFLRQMIGWREFMRAMYEFRGVHMRNSNFWDFHRKMPPGFYTGQTGVEPVDHVIRKVLLGGFCHHIERLMVLGNFMLLCRIHPDEVYRWFMEMFVDSYDWVMVPNVYGMSQFADGGGFTTKPYISGSNYIRKMSDFKQGSWCEIWDALFWTFIGDHEKFFSKNPRLALMTASWHRMELSKKSALKNLAAEYLAKLDATPQKG